MARETRKDCRGGSSSSKLQSPQTTKWLYDNYEISDGVSLPRSLLYNHYLDFCQKKALKPINAASFGKIIRHTFPTLKTRRLGTRGQSKYHYYGISVKSSSPYHDSVLNSARQSSSGFSQTYKKSEADDKLQSASLRGHVGQVPQPGSQLNCTLLPEFPSAESFNLTPDIPLDKAKTFLIMYRAHCQRILDTILRANFSEVQNYLVHFWQGMPKHILVILGSQKIINLICCCDNILYKAIGAVLIPGTLQPLPSSLTQAISQFAKQLGHWLEVSLFYLPENLQDRKLEVAKAFSQLLCRQTSVSHLAQAARSVLNNQDSVSQMNQDLKDIDLYSIVGQCIWISSDRPGGKESQLLCQFFEEFCQLLEQPATIDQYADWIEELVNICVVKPSEKDEGLFQKCAQKFLLQWSFLTSKIIMELTLKSAKSFGSFHLLQMLFDDYILYLIESRVTVLDGSEDTADSKARRDTMPTVDHVAHAQTGQEEKDKQAWYYAARPQSPGSEAYSHLPYEASGTFSSSAYDYRFAIGATNQVARSYDCLPHDTPPSRAERPKETQPYLAFSPSAHAFAPCSLADGMMNTFGRRNGQVHLPVGPYHGYTADRTAEQQPGAAARGGMVARRLFNHAVSELRT